MTQWIGDKWRLKAGPQLGQVNSNESAEGTTTEKNPEPRRCGYTESFIQEYDGIKVYHHQGSYQHIGPQIYSWAFYEYRMVINSECWNIIIDENMKEVPSSFPGSNSAKLTHDFCHVDSESSDDVYTSFSFVEMGGRTIWPFYTTESFQEDLWIWVSPRRFAIISQHPNNEKLNRFYSNKMHEHHILANRAKCWNTYIVDTDGSKKKGTASLPSTRKQGFVGLIKKLLPLVLKTSMICDRQPIKVQCPMGNVNTQAPLAKALPNLSMLQVPIVPETCKL